MPFFDVERKIEAAQLRVRIREIGETIYSQRQPIGKIEYCVTGRGRGPERTPTKGWKPFVWVSLGQSTMFRMRAIVPPSMKANIRGVYSHDDCAVRSRRRTYRGGEALAYVTACRCWGLIAITTGIPHRKARGERFDALEARRARGTIITTIPIRRSRGDEHAI